MDLHKPGLLPPGVQGIHRFTHASGHRAHGHDHPVRVRGAVIIEQAVFPPGQRRYPGHVVLHHVGKRGVIAVVGLPHLEIDIGVLHRGPDHRVFRVQGLSAESLQGVPVQHIPQGLVGHFLHLVDLVGGAEAVEEMDEGHPCPDSRKMGDAGQVHDLLDGAGGKHGKAGLAAVHYVRMVAENGKGVGADGAAGHMQNPRQALAGDAVHRRDHQHQSLGGGEAGRQGAGLQGAVDRGDGAGFRLHFHQAHRLPEQVLLPFGAPKIGLPRHRRGGRNGINRRHVGEGVGDIGGGLVAVHGHKTFIALGHLLFPPQSQMKSGTSRRSFSKESFLPLPCQVPGNGGSPVPMPGTTSGNPSRT